ncbi:hypothetical protein SHO565_67420 [Streptomyces sp. HO565]
MRPQGGGGRQGGAPAADDNPADARASPRDPGTVHTRPLALRRSEQVVLGAVPGRQQRPAQYGAAAQGAGAHLGGER